MFLKRCEKPSSKTGFKVAIIGSGPAGLQAASYLICRGHEVHVYEKLPEPGGLLVFGIPPRRIPKDRIRDGIKELEKLGVEFKTKVKVSESNIYEIGDELCREVIKFSELIQRYDATIIATGAWRSRMLGIEGENVTNVTTALHYILHVRLKELGYVEHEIDTGSTVVVIGAGRTAADVIEELGLRGKNIVLIYRRRLSESRAYKELSELVQKFNVRVFEQRQPVRIAVQRDKAVGIEVAPVELKDGKFVVDMSKIEFIECDFVVEAIGEEPSPPFTEDEARRLGIELKNGKIVINENYMTTREGVFAAGDVVLGPSSIGDATKMGIEVAKKVDEYLIRRR